MDTTKTGSARRKSAGGAVSLLKPKSTSVTEDATLCVERMTDDQLVRYVVAKLDQAIAKSPWTHGPLALNAEDARWQGNCERDTFGAAVADIVFADDDPLPSPIAVSLRNEGRAVEALVCERGLIAYSKGWVTVEAV